MKKIILIAIFICVFFLGYAAGRDDSFRGSGVSVLDSCKQDKQDLLRLINEQRAIVGSSALEFDERLSWSAQVKAQDFVERNYYEHELGQEDWYKFIIESGYFDESFSVGENLTRDIACNDEVISDWLNSPPHKHTMLSPEWNDVGLGWYNGFVVAHFGVENAD